MLWVRDIFSEASTLVYTNVGYSSFYIEQHWKKYSDCELCANFIRDARMYPELNHEIYDEITLIIESVDSISRDGPDMPYM